MRKRYLIAPLCLAVVITAGLIFHSLFPSTADTTNGTTKQVRHMNINRSIGTVEDAYCNAAFAAICTVEKKHPSAENWWESQQISTDFTLRILRTTNPDEGAVGDTVRMRMRGGETDDAILTVSDSHPDKLEEGQTYLILFSEPTSFDPENPIYLPLGADNGIFLQTDTKDDGSWRSLHGDWSIDASTLVPTDAGDVPLLSLFSEP
ncbi:MAG: hypothetical protein E7604_13295 [Ruminococcaceae bacterium]|nr:hypothetical protein [Oscillospiraceae bacterium]